MLLVFRNRRSQNLAILSSTISVKIPKTSFGPQSAGSTGTNYNPFPYDSTGGGNNMLTQRSGRRVAYLAVTLLLAVLQPYAQPAPAGPSAVHQPLHSVLSQMTLEEKIEILRGFY